jgi:exosortase A-associated hydrolase 1
MSVREDAVLFPCGEDTLVGIVSHSDRPAAVGVIIVVGGPQYRAGSHRQFTLLARRLAEEHIPAFRFDYRGMGDACGERRSFDQVDDDLCAAITAFMSSEPALDGVVLWGLCDAASAALIYAPRDERVKGLVLLNPWVRDTQTQAVTQMKHYYLKRLMDRGFWKKLMRGGVQWRASARSLMRTSRAALDASGPAQAEARSFQDRMLAGWQRFAGPVLLVMSGRDLTAREFAEYSEARPAWRDRLASSTMTRIDLPDADHTFSNRHLRDRVATETLIWLRRTLSADSPPPALGANPTHHP